MLPTPPGGEIIKYLKMRFFLFLLTLLFFSCSGSKTSYYDGRHYLHLKLLVAKKNQEFKIINSRRELQPFGFLINGNWRRISDSTLILVADSNVYNHCILPDSFIVKATDDFNWEIYNKYGNNYIFPFFRTDTLYELNHKKNVRIGTLFFYSKRKRTDNKAHN